MVGMPATVVVNPLPPGASVMPGGRLNPGETTNEYGGRPPRVVPENAPSPRANTNGAPTDAFGADPLMTVSSGGATPGGVITRETAGTFRIAPAESDTIT